MDQIITYIQETGLQQRLGLESPLTVSFLAQGECNQNYLITDGSKQFVFRLNYESQLNLPNQIEYEYQALMYLRRSKRTPIPYWVDDSRHFFPQGVLVMGFIKGRPLDYNRDLMEAANIFRDIHGLPVASFSDMKREDQPLSERVTECHELLKPVFKSPHMSSKQLHLFEEALDACQQGTNQEKWFQECGTWCLNNTEVNSHNFIIGPDQGWLIDWEKPVISHPCQDLTQFLVSTTTLWRGNRCLAIAEKQQFISRYVSGSGIDQRELEEALEIYSPYMMLRALAWSAMAYDQYLSGTKALKNQVIFKKISQYLDPIFLEKALKEKVLADD